jgi:hypothetical protein
VSAELLQTRLSAHLYRHPARFAFTTAFGFPRMTRVEGSSEPFGTIHQQPHARHLK